MVRLEDWNFETDSIDLEYVVRELYNWQQETKSELVVNIIDTVMAILEDACLPME